MCKKLIFNVGGIAAKEKFIIGKVLLHLYIYTLILAIPPQRPVTHHTHGMGTGPTGIMNGVSFYK